MPAPAAKERPVRGTGRDRTLAAALDVFSQRGYDAASIADIASEANITKSVIYHHFGSKSGLYRAAIETESASLIAEVDEAVSGADPSQRLRSAVEAYFSFLEARPEAWKLLLRDAPADVDLRRLHERLQSQRAEALLKIIGAGKRTSKAKRAQAELLGTAIRSFATWWYDHRDIRRGVVVDAVLDMAAASFARIS